MGERFLLALDDSPASSKAVDYLARVIDGTPDASVHLVHVLPPVPAGLLQEEGMDESRRSERTRWIEEAKYAAEPLIQAARERLAGAELAADAIDSGFLIVHPEGSVVEGLLDLGRDHACETIVVGRNTLPWYREWFHHHVGDELVKKARGYTVWVVE